jgi:hypothetical protein
MVAKRWYGREVVKYAGVDFLPRMVDLIEEMNFQGIFQEGLE